MEVKVRERHNFVMEGTTKWKMFWKIKHGQKGSYVVYDETVILRCLPTDHLVGGNNAPLRPKGKGFYFIDNFPFQVVTMCTRTVDMRHHPTL